MMNSHNIEIRDLSMLQTVYVREKENEDDICMMRHVDLKPRKQW